MQVRERIPGLDVGFYVADSMGLRVLEDMLRVAEPASGLGSSPGEAEIAVTLPGVLRADDYLVGIYVYSGHDYYVVEEPLRFRVAPAPGESEDGIASGGATAAELVRHRGRAMSADAAPTPPVARAASAAVAVRLSAPAPAARRPAAGAGAARRAGRRRPRRVLRQPPV